MLNFILCDDNIPTLNRLSKMLETIFIKHEIDAEVSLKTPSPYDVVNYINENKVDVVILDINLKSTLNGCDLADTIRKKNKNAYIIFLTGHLEYALLAYKYKTFDYLSKPITDERLEGTILRLIEDMNSVSSKFIKLNNNKTIINQNEINYIKKDGMKLVFCSNNHDYEIYGSFNKIKNCLSENFVRCHKSYMVNLNNIVDYNNKTNTILFNNNTTCTVGLKYQQNFKEVLKNGNSIENLECINS